MIRDARIDRFLGSESYDLKGMTQFLDFFGDKS